MKLLNNKDLKLALRDARELCPNEEAKDILSKDNIMLTDIFHGNEGVKFVLEKALPLMETWDDEMAENVKTIFKKYIKMEHRILN